MNEDSNQMRTTGLTFGHVLDGLQYGERFTREGWNGKDMWIALQVPDVHSKMTLPYIYMKTVQGDLVPWVVSQTDCLARDWALYLLP